MIEQGNYPSKQTIIDDDCWIGRSAIFTPGRRFAKGSKVVAKCVLAKDFPEYSVIGGNPSMLIKKRFETKV